MNGNKKPVIFAISSYEYMLQDICKQTGFDHGLVEVKHFPDGERYQRILTPVDERDVIIIGGTPTDPDVLELYDLASSVVKYRAMSITLVIPYYGYSTMERAVKTGEIVTAKTRARLLSSIPMAPFGNRVVLLDLHSEGIPHYFEEWIVPVHLYAKDVILDACRELGGKDFVMACTDAGRAKWVESLANDLGVNASFVFKRRLSGEKTEITAVSAHVQDKDVVIYDDMIRTGGSLISAAKAYLDAGAASVSAVATHAVLPGNAPDKLKSSGIFRKIICTDSHPRALELQDDLLEVKTVSGVISDYLKEHLG